MPVPVRSGLMALALLAMALPATAQNQTQRVRGTIQTLDGSVLTVKTREGSTVPVRLADNVAVSTVKAIALADITPGSFIGTATMAMQDGGYRALEVLVFPDSMRGTGEGKFPWDLEPDSTMINAAVGTVAATGDGRMLQVAHKGTTDKVLVPPGIPVVTFVPADRSALRPGTKVFIGGAQKAPDGGLTATRITAGKDGVDPPM